MRFTFDIIGEFELDEDQIFPDGVPDDLTTAVVMDAVKTSTTSVVNLVKEWNLLPLELTICGPDGKSERWVSI